MTLRRAIKEPVNDTSYYIFVNLSFICMIHNDSALGNNMEMIITEILCVVIRTMKQSFQSVSTYPSISADGLPKRTKNRTIQFLSDFVFS